MNSTFFENLLYEGESTTLDFKRDQYPFVGADDEQKSELLKDIIGFANAFRRDDAYILIGVEDVQGGRGVVHGVSEHLPDHSVQQFVNNKTNKPIRFHYEPMEFEGKQIGIIRIEKDQVKPIFLKSPFGKLKANEVYVRRGSSTDPTKPANPDEIALMGAAQHGNMNLPIMVVEFAEIGHDKLLGTSKALSVEFCAMPGSSTIPNLSQQRGAGKFSGLEAIAARAVLDGQPNEDFFREFAYYEAVRRLFRKLRLAILNNGECVATNVYVEICFEQGIGIFAFSETEIPDLPVRVESYEHRMTRITRNIRPAASRRAGDVEIERTDAETKLMIKCGDIQPKRPIWTDEFFMGIRCHGKTEINGKVFAANLPNPKEFKLTFDVELLESTLTVNELVKLANGIGKDES